MCLLPVGVHILPVRYELVEIEVIVVWFGLVVICGVITPRWGKWYSFDGSGLPFVGCVVGVEIVFRGPVLYVRWVTVQFSPLG